MKPRYFTRKRQQGHKPGEMNSTETAYRDLLVDRVAAATIHRFLFEAITFKLADDVRYTPDFAVWMPDGTLEFHEGETVSFWYNTGNSGWIRLSGDSPVVKTRVVIGAANG